MSIQHQGCHAVTNFPVTNTLRQLRDFLGLVIFYRCFIPQYAGLLQPLTDLLKAPRSPYSTTPRPPQAQSVFVAPKQAVAGASLLVLKCFDAPTRIVIDASSVAIGEMLQHYNGYEWRPLSYFSRMLQFTGTRYSAFGREL